MCTHCSLPRFGDFTNWLRNQLKDRDEPKAQTWLYLIICMNMPSAKKKKQTKLVYVRILKKKKKICIKIIRTKTFISAENDHKML